jgi:hypothetical protein
MGTGYRSQKSNYWVAADLKQVGRAPGPDQNYLKSINVRLMFAKSRSKSRTASRTAVNYWVAADLKQVGRAPGPDQNYLKSINVRLMFRKPIQK